MKKVVILGSTGSIGTQALDVLSRYPDEYEIIALSANENIDLLEEQVRRFKPTRIAVINEEKAKMLRRRISSTVEILPGREALVELASMPDVDIVLMSVVGISGLEATIAALEAGKDVALANKETLVAGGQLVMAASAKTGARIIPVDSEHSAIFQCLQGSYREDLSNIILTASGGPFRTFTYEQLEQVTIEDALKHPNWSMGKKVTIDSATMMNKGLEVIEAKWLFDLTTQQIRVLVHPQSIIHSMIEFYDGSVIAQMGVPDMRIPILYAFTYPRRHQTMTSRLDLADVGTLTFETPNTVLFPCLSLAFQAIELGGTMPAVLNAANEVAVGSFLQGSIQFTDIPRMIENAMNAHQVIKNPTLKDILQTDKETRGLYL